MSHIIASVRVALAKHFVPHYLGLGHLSREDVINKHTSPLASRLLTEDGNPCILVLDGTYLFIQVSMKDFFLSRKLSYFVTF